MPFIRIALRRGASAENKEALIDGVQKALVETFDIPGDDRFAFVDEYDKEAMVFPAQFLGREYSDQLIVVSITASEGRTPDQKRNLYGAIARNIGARAGIASADIIINLIETSRDNWSFGGGVSLYGSEVVDVGN